MKEILDFLNELKMNNNREWFSANKKKYLNAKAVFERFVEELIPRIVLFDAEIGLVTAKDCIFRINRDTRFSPDKTPYKTNFGAYITPGGKKGSRGGYYFHIEPGMSMLASGIYMPESELLKAIRNEIYFRAEEFKKILNDKNFLKYFPELINEEKLKNPPKDFPKDFPDIELLKYKHYAVSCTFSNDILLSPGLLEFTEKAFKVTYPLNNFLREAINMMGQE